MSTAVQDMLSISIRMRMADIMSNYDVMIYRDLLQLSVTSNIPADGISFITKSWTFWRQEERGFFYILWPPFQDPLVKILCLSWSYRGHCFESRDNGIVHLAITTRIFGGVTQIFRDENPSFFIVFWSKGIHKPLFATGWNLLLRLRSQEKKSRKKKITEGQEALLVTRIHRGKNPAGFFVFSPR